MRTKFKKIITSLILVVMMLNYMTTTCFADTSNVLGIDEDNVFNTILGKAVDGVDGVVGIITTKARVIAVAITAALQGLTSILGHVDGSNTGSKSKIMITVEDIFFNKLNITRIDFFDMNSGTAGKISSQFRVGVATWYYVLRNLAIIILLCILIYVGIRMAISTVASEKAMYKNMLKDWIVSFILVFFMHYIIVVTIQVNNSLVDIFAKSAGSSGSWGADYMNTLFINAIGIDPAGGIKQFSFLKSWASTIVYAMMVFLTLAFLWTYVKRMITLAFLIIISPLVTVTYAIDKMGDNKSQALNTWLKEFIYNVLLQPFHCIIYLALMKSSITSLTSSKASLGMGALVIMCMMFTFGAEKIVRKIFGFEKASSIADTMATTGAMMAGFNTLKKIGPKAKVPAGASKAGKAAANTTNAGLAKNAIANKNIARAMEAAKNLAPVKAAASATSKVANTSAGKFISNSASKASEGMKNLKSQIESSLQSSADKGTPIQKMAANMALAAGQKVSEAGNNIRKDIKGAVSSVGNFTRAINTTPGAIQAAMTMVGVSAGLTTGNASNAITYGIAGNEIGAKMAAPAQERYRDNQERKFAEKYKDCANALNVINDGCYDLTTEEGREAFKEWSKGVGQNDPAKHEGRFKWSVEEYRNCLENRIRKEHSGDSSWTEDDTKRQAKAEFNNTYSEMLNGNMQNIKEKYENLMDKSDWERSLYGDRDEYEEEALALNYFAHEFITKDLSDNIQRMMGIEAALGDEDPEKTVLTGKNSTIDRINAGIEDEEARNQRP